MPHVMKRKNAFDRRRSPVLVVASLFLVVSFGGCATQTPMPPECPSGYERVSLTDCAPIRKAKLRDVDNRPIPYDPRKIDNSPIRLPDGQTVPYTQRVPPSSAMTGEKGTNPLSKTGAQAVPENPSSTSTKR
jgi:hypothetical protein